MKKRLLSLVLVATLLFTFFNVPIGAREVTLPMEASFSVSKEAVKPGETVKVSFCLDNYNDTAVPGIKAFDGHLKVDENLGILENVQSAMVMNNGDGFDTNLAEDGTLYMFYEASWSTPTALNDSNTETDGDYSYYILPRDNKTLFTFDLVVNKEITADQLEQALFETMEFTFADADGNEISVDYTVPALDVLAEAPQILLNGEPVKETAYTEMVEVSSDKGTVVLKDEDQNVIEDKIAKVDGVYTVTAADAAGNESVAEFTVRLGVNSVEVAANPNKMQYYVGEALDLSGGMLQLVYANEEITKQISMTADSVTVEGYDPNTVGKQELTVSYTENGKTVTTKLEVEVLENEVKTISWNSLPEKLRYIEGQELDLTGGSIDVVYANGEESTIALSSSMISGYDRDEIGEQTVTVNYGDQKLTFIVTVKEKTVTGIKAVLENPQQKIDTTFDEKGTVIVSYDNDTTQEVSFSDEAVVLSYPEGMMESLGPKKITVAYQGEETIVTLTVIDKVLTGMEVQAPNKTSYLEGQGLDLTGGELILSYDNGTTEEVPLTEAEISGYAPETIGSQTITVTYGGFTDTFEVVVKAKSISDISWNEKPTKTEFMEREAFAVDGSILLSFDNGTSEVVNVTADMVTGFHSEQPGIQKLTVTYPGCDQTLTYEVTVAEKKLNSIYFTKLPEKVNYLQQEDGTLDLTGMEVYGRYDNGYDYLIDNSQVTISGYDSNQPGVQMVTVSYEGAEAQFTVMVHSRENVDVLEQKIDSMDANALAVEDEQTVLELLAAYEGLTEMEQDGFSDAQYQQLKALEAQMNKLVKPQREETFENTGWVVAIPGGTIRYDVSFTASQVEVRETVLTDIRAQLGDLSEVLSAMRFTVDGRARTVQYLPAPASLRYTLETTDDADRLRVVGQTADDSLSVIPSHVEENDLVFQADEDYQAYYVVLADTSAPPAGNNNLQQGTDIDDNTPNPGVQDDPKGFIPDTSDSFFGIATMLLAVSGVMILVLLRRKYDA